MVMGGVLCRVAGLPVWPEVALAVGVVPELALNADVLGAP